MMRTRFFMACGVKVGQRFGSGDGERMERSDIACRRQPAGQRRRTLAKASMTRQLPYEPLPASVLFGDSGSVVGDANATNLGEVEELSLRLS